MAKDNHVYNPHVIYWHTITSSEVSTVGYQTISNTGSLGEFDGTTVPAIATQTDYELDITIDGGSLNQLADISIANTDDWDAIALAIETSLQTATGSTETVEIDTDGNIRVTSATSGVSSSVLIAAGTAGTGSGDLLGVIDALGATYVTNIDTAVDGTDGSVEMVIYEAPLPTSEFIYMIDIVRSDVNVTGDAVSSYSKTTGKLTITDGSSTYALTSGDVVKVLGFWYDTALN